MAILEKIRKRTTVLILIIGLALFAFVISGMFNQGSFGMTKVGSAVGEINGEAISIDDFRTRMEAMEASFGPQSTSTQIVNAVWDQSVRQAILDQEFEKLGIDIQQDQIMEVIRTNPNFTSNPQFQDADGYFDADLFRNFISELRVNQPQQYQLWLQTEQNLIQAAKEQTYFDLIRAGVGATLKEGEREYHLANDKVDIRFVRVPYSNIPDSTVTVSKEEIAAYVKEHPAEFKQEAARDLRYVFFEEKASVEDEQAIKDGLAADLEDESEYLEASDTTVVRAGFRNTDDMADFLVRKSDIKFDTIFKAKNQLPAQFADSIFDLPVGGIYGPYKEGNMYKYTRMMARKPNGSVKASHILVAYQGAMRAAESVTRNQEEAEARAKELLVQAKANPENFAQLARDNSDGPSAPSGGDLGYFEEGVMTTAFNDFAFGNAVGTIDLVETEFGFHIVKVDDKRDVVQVATLARTIEPTTETVNNLFTEVTTLEMAVMENPETFRGISEEKGYDVRPVNQIKAMDENLPGLGAQRAIVRWAFDEATEIGDIRRFDLPTGYAVVQLTGTYRAGTMSPEDASVQVLPKLRKEKKARQLEAANQGKSLDEIASANGVIVSTATALNAKSPTIPGAGREPRVVGTALNMDNGEVSGIIEGETGIFKVEVTNRTIAPAMENYAPYAATKRSAVATRINADVYNALKEKAEIEDNRAVFY